MPRRTPASDAPVPDDGSMRDYELLDVGGGARLERFGDRIVDRPAPGALAARGDQPGWRSPDLRFDRERGWTGPRRDDGPWPVQLEGFLLELRATDAGQVGLYPEHLAMQPWLLSQSATNVLNLFAYTGAATLALAAAGRAVTHLDAARPSVAWARHNADLSSLKDRPVRWIVDDAAAFVAREARRGHRYDGLIVDPPSYGHGAGGRPWRLESDLDPLLAACRTVLAPEGFALVTAHTPGFDEARLAAAISRGLRRPADRIDTGSMGIATADGRRLDLGSFARIASGA